MKGMDRRGEDLHLPEPAVERGRMEPPEGPENADHDEERDERPRLRRDDDGGEDLGDPPPFQDAVTPRGDHRADDPADDRVGRRGGDTVGPGGKNPEERPGG